VPGEVIRFVMLSTHYRKPMDWTEKKRVEAEKTLKKWYALATQAGGHGVVPEGVLAAVCDDLNTAGALAEMYKVAANQGPIEMRGALVFLGLLDPIATLPNGIPEWATQQATNLPGLAKELTLAREAAKESKDFSEVDRLKSLYVSAGLEVQMTKDSVFVVVGPDYDPSKLEGLL